MIGYEDWSLAGWRTHLPGVADLQDHVAGLGDETIPALAAAAAGRVPDRVAVTVDGEPVTHAELDDAAGRVAAWLARRVHPGDRVLLAAGASAGFVRCYLGALRAGAVVVLANPGYTAAELGHLVADSGAVLAFADPEPARRLAGLGAGDRRSAPLMTVDVRELPGPTRPTTGIVARPHDTALLAYTSGTTGRPKGVPLTHRQLAVSIRAAMAAWRWHSDDVLVHALPLYHQHGLGGLHTALIAGGTVHIRSKFSAADLVRAAGDTRASVLFAVPTIYQALMDSPTALADGLRGLRLAVCGSAPLSPALAERLPTVLGRLPLVRYGTTESGLDVSNPVADPRGDTIGVPLPGVLARIRAAAEPGGSRPGRRDPAPRAAGLRGLLERPGGDRGRLHPGRLVPHRRHRVRGPGHRAPGDPRPDQGNDHHRRPERLSPRGGDRAREPSVGGGGGRGGRPRRAVGRAGDRLGGPGGRVRVRRGRAHRARPDAAGRV